MIDPLAEVVTLLQPAATLSKIVGGAGRWRLRRTDAGQPFYCVVLHGGCRLAAAGQKPVALTQGDFVLISPARRWCTEASGWPDAGRAATFLGMPFKHNAAHRHCIPRARYRVTNWPAYEAGLRRRGDLTLWLDEVAVAGWSAPKRSTPGGQPIYSDLAIELVLMLRLAFRLALRQAEAFARSILRLLGLDLSVPDHSTLSRRGRAFAGRCPRVLPSRGPIHLVLDSTGLELFGQGEWNAAKHGPTRRNWRKLHLAVDAVTGEIAAHVLTDGSVDDAAQMPLLLRDVEGQIASVTGDGAYDGDPTYQAVAARQRRSPPDVIIPPRASAVLSTDNPDAQSQRDRHIRLIAEQGRIGWQRATGYGRRNHAETAIGRYKHPIGPKLRARTLSGQQGEVAIGVSVLNRMSQTGKPVSVRA